MIMLNMPGGSPVQTGRGIVLREFVPRVDRVPRDQRVDMPEIQESSRVSFSNAALAAASGRVRESVQRPTSVDDGGSEAGSRTAFQLRLYRDIAAL
jgi:hypothetical protein